MLTQRKVAVMLFNRDGVAGVHGHEKVLACGQLDVLAYGRVEVLAPL
jgi:hypothetical protein